MAEEFDIRSVWKKSKDRTDHSKMMSDRLELRKKRNSLDWIRIILSIELWISILSAPIISYSLSTEGYSIYVIIGYLLITIIYLFYYRFLIKQIKAFNYDKNILDSLKRIHSYLRFYLLHYKVVIWLSLLAGVLLGFLADENRQNLEVLSTSKEWIIAISITLILAILIGLIFNLIIYLIYGRKVKRIKKMIQSLEQD